MTIGELKQAVIDLGFDTEIEVETAFYNATNRAIIEINDIEPKQGVFSVSQFPLTNIVQEDKYKLAITQKTDDIEVYPLGEPKAYSFDCDGNGTAYVEQYNEATQVWDVVSTITMLANREYKPYKGFITAEGKIRLRFSGDYVYNLRNIAMYERVYGATLNDIPLFRPFYRYDIQAEGTGFLELSHIVVQEGEQEREYYLNKDYYVENNKVVVIPHSAEGQFNIWYRKYPDRIASTDDEETEIDLTEELAALLPELVASYVWLDGENINKAQRYYELYKIRAAEIRRKKEDKQGVFIYKTQGWA